MNRRKFVSLSLAAAAGITASSQSESINQSTSRDANQAVGIISVPKPATRGALMPADFTGLSYEAGQLYNADFFSPQNTALIDAFRTLSHNGVLRLGGHLSNITPWEGVGLHDPRQLRGVRHGIEDYWEWPLVDPSVQHNKKGIITHKAIKSLRGFLDAVNWRLIYGLNFASGSAARAADEASTVSNAMGHRLIAFVVGNEVDGFGEDPIFRPKDYDFNQYFAEYETWIKTIRATVPHASFAGPDTEDNINTWVQEYAQRTKGDAVLITSHFYGMGPASNPAMTAERLLQKVNPALDELIAGAKAASIAAGGTPYRMDEGNSCFGGGRPGVSDAYASALWAADFMLHAACAGFAGVNLHGGGTGFYTPIETSEQSPAKPRPVYYGMQFAQQFSEFNVAPCALRTSANVTAYWGTKGQQAKLAVINKGASPVRLSLPSLRDARLTESWVLRGPSLGAKTGVELIRQSPPHSMEHIELPSYSAILLHAG